MDKKVKGVLETIGVIATIWGIVTSIQNESVVSTVLLFIFLGLLLFILYKDKLIKSVEFHEIEYQFTICDINGEKAICRKSKKFTVYSNGFTTLHDKNIGGTGSVNLLKSNMGHPMSYVEGGSISLVTMFNPPLKKDVEHRHYIEMEYTKCFTQNKESVVIQADRKCSIIRIFINFPDQRLCRSVKAYLFFDDSAEELSKPSIIDSGKKVEFIINKPKQYGKYNIEFRW